MKQVKKWLCKDLKTVGKSLNAIDKKIDKNLANMEKVNGRMKETLEEVGRASDKLMVDIMCIVFMIGFGAVIYNYATGD